MQTYKDRYFLSPPSQRPDAYRQLARAYVRNVLETCQSCVAILGRKRARTASALLPAMVQSG
jgi:hypothetical protein